MRNIVTRHALILLWIGLSPMGWAQFLSIGGGTVISQDLSRGPAQAQVGSRASSNFDSAGTFAFDLGLPIFPFVTGGLHYSFASPELFLERGDAFGSSARVGLGAHTLTFDAHLRTPSVNGWRAYGLAGAGFTRFSVDVKEVVESPFPGGAPDKVLSPVLTYGGGIQRHLHGLTHVKFEVRDYLTGVSQDLFRPGGAWHRVVVLAGITIGI